MTQTGIADKALELLGQGVSQEQTALALGVSARAISQLMAQDEFAQKVQELRFNNLQSRNIRDATLDKLEDEAIKRLDSLMPLVMKPMEATRILQVVNAAKRRGASAPEHITNTREVVNLTLPVSIVAQFQISTTSDNRVISAGDQELVTIQSHRLGNLLEKKGVSQNGGAEQKRINDGSRSKQLPAVAKPTEIFDL
jgi:predicted transcriptional regulator